jgi:phage-related protein
MTTIPPRDTRPINWIRGAQRDFEDFPSEARLRFLHALTMIAEGSTPDIAKPLTGLGSGVMELALRHRGDAFRLVYALKVDQAIWVVHAFQKKSKTGRETPKQEIDVVRERIKRLKEMLQ